MDRDDMRDDIERVMRDLRAAGANPQEHHDALARLSRLVDFETYSRHPLHRGGPFTPPPTTFLNESLPCVGDMPLCPDCLEFGTICRPCRAERYEAGVAARRAAERAHVRRGVWVALAAGAALIGLGLVAQALADRQCGTGARWDASDWQCVAR